MKAGVKKFRFKRSLPKVIQRGGGFVTLSHSKGRGGGGGKGVDKKPLHVENYTFQNTESVYLNV